MRKSGTHFISQEEKSLDYSTICHKMFQVHPTIDGSWNEESANKQITSICKNVLNRKKRGEGTSEHKSRWEEKAFLNFSDGSLCHTFEEHIMTDFRQKIGVSEVPCTVFELLLRVAEINTKEIWKIRKKLHLYVASIAMLWLTSLCLKLSCMVQFSPAQGKSQFCKCITSLFPTVNSQVQMLHQAWIFGHAIENAFFLK